MSTFGGPSGSDASGTQPMPRVSAPGAKPPKPPRAVRVPGDWQPKYGNLAFYLLFRLLALLIDIPLLAFLAVTFFTPPLHIATTNAAAINQSNFGFVLFLSLAGAMLFALLCEAIAGTTVGKALFALHVHRVQGGHAGIVRAFGRAVLRPIDLVLIGPILAAATPRHQRLGDLISGTTVARSPIGLASPLIAILLLGGAGYAQVVYGGGFDSALSVAAETANGAPAWAGGVTGALATVFPNLANPNSAGPSTGASAAPASPTPTPAASSAPYGIETAVPLGTAAPAATESAPAAIETAPPAIETAPPALETAPPASQNQLVTPLPASGGATPV